MTGIRDKNEPGRFLGEGVSFRAKLIGVLEVPEARGDRMCQEALADLKMAIRAAGEHKQRIQVHVAIDGLRLRDDKTGDSLYHHPVHKISFIAQDMTDSRAFGYIFGSPDTGHRFFGIKTDKAASQVVIAMRDLFQVVFELKKKEVELAKQQLEGKSSGRHISVGIVDFSKAKFTNLSKTTTPSQTEASTSTSKQPEQAEGGVADLVDLEQELSSLRRGLTQVEGLTPSTDPFGDSFTAPTNSQKGLLPPPPATSAGRGRTPATKVLSPGKGSTSLPFDPLASIAAEFDTPPATSASLADNFATTSDPTELKNPPKKVLKDLVPQQAQTHSLLSDLHPIDKGYGHTTMTSLSRHSGGTVTVAKSSQSQPSHYSGSYFTADPFAETDPFDNTDPFDSYKDDPFTSMQEFPKSILRTDDASAKKAKGSKEVKELRYDKTSTLERQDTASSDSGKNVFNGPLQVTLPPEATPKSPRLSRQSGESGSIRQRPSANKLPSDSASPPPPLPPKKPVDHTKPPPRRPHDTGPDDSGASDGPPLPRPSRKKEPYADRSTKPRVSAVSRGPSSEEEYLTPAPPPLPAARRFDITLSQLLVCTMPELAQRLRVPEATLSSMTLPQLTEYLRSYLAADNERAHINVEPSTKSDKDNEKKSRITIIPPIPPDKKPLLPLPFPLDLTINFPPHFEDNFTPPDSNDTFVANFDDFDIKAVNPSYDRYAAFREIQEQELKSKSILDPDSPKDESKDSDDKEELTAINKLAANDVKEDERKENSRSPLKTLDELTLDSFNMFRNSVSPKTTQIDTKIEDIKSVLKNLQVDAARRSVSPRENNIEKRSDDSKDRYAALREITITEPSQDDYESLPSEGHLPIERKRSDEKSDGFDNSDFFDCIDNSSLTFSHVEDAFRKSPRSREDVFISPRLDDDTFRNSPRSEEDAFRSSPPLVEDAFSNSPRLEDDAFKNSPRIEDDVFKKSPSLKEDRFKKSPRFEEESFKGNLHLEEESFKNSLRLDEAAFKKSIRLKEDLFKKSPRVENNGFKKSPRLEEDSFSKSPRVENNGFKNSPRLDDEAFSKSPRFEEDAFKKSPRLEAVTFGKIPRLDEDVFKSSPRLEDYKFRKSPSMKDREVRIREELKTEEKKEPVELTPQRDLRPPQRLSTGSISDMASASSPDTKADKQARAGVAAPLALAGGCGGGAGGGGRWAVLGGGAASAGSSDSRDSEPRPRRQRHDRDRRPVAVSSSSSRSASPWDEEPPPPPPPLSRLQRAPPPHHRDRHSRHGSSGSRECLDSGSGREKDKRDRDSRTVTVVDRDRDRRDSRDRHDSGSGRDRRDSKERDHRDRRDRRSRERDRENDTWERDRDRAYSREREYREPQRDRSKSYKDKDRERRKPRLSYDEDEEEYSDGDVGGSGRSSPRDRWTERWRRDERKYGSLGWRESRRRNETRPTDEPDDRRYGSTLGRASRRTGSRRAERDHRDRLDSRDSRDGRDSRESRDSRDTRDNRDGRDSRDSRRRSRKEEQRPKPRDYRFSNDFSPRERDDRDVITRDEASPFDEFQDTPPPNAVGKAAKRTPAYASLDSTRFSFEPEEVTASPLSLSSARRDDHSARFRFDSDSLSPRSMFEDDFTAITPRGRAASIAEEEEGELPPLRQKPADPPRDIRKSDSINIFTREADPFEGDAFFACTGSDKAARRENWPGDFH